MLKLKHYIETHQEALSFLMILFCSGFICGILLLSYFDERDIQECGVCDVCLDKKKKSFYRDNLIKELLIVLDGKSLVLSDLINALKTGSEKDKLEAVRILLDAGEIKRSGEFYHL